MKIIASIILTIALSLGTLAAATAYTVSLDTPDEQLVGQTLKFGAGKNADDGPIIDSDTTLTEADLVTLRDAGVEHIHVKEFRFGLWRQSWVFGLSMVGLVGGAMMLRVDAKRKLRAADNDPHGTSLSPNAAISQARAAVDELRADLSAMATDQDRLEAILERIGDVQRVQITAFVGAREKLVGRFGLAGYARVMDRFAAAERQVNRAWSAAADHELQESVVCLDRGSDLFGEVERLLGR